MNYGLEMKGGNITTKSNPLNHIDSGAAGLKGQDTKHDIDQDENVSPENHHTTQNRLKDGLNEYLYGLKQMQEKLYLMQTDLIQFKLPDLDTRSSNISVDLWRALPEDTKHKVKLLEAKDVKPPSIKGELWDACDDELKALLLYQVRVIPYRSAVKSFFFEFDINMDNYESAINAMALVLALLITVPFSVLPNLSPEYFDTLKASLDACEHNRGHSYNTLKNLYITNSAAIIYASLCGLVLASNYYLFKPSEQHVAAMLDGSCDTGTLRYRMQFLMFTLYICTIAAAVGVMNLTSNLFEYYTVDSGEQCSAHNATGVWITGTVIVIFTVIMTFALLW